MDLTEYYRALAKQLKPDTTDEEINSQLHGVSDDKLRSALGSLAPTDSAPADPMALQIKDPNTVGSSFDVDSSDDTLKAKGAGVMPEMSQQDMDASGIKTPLPVMPYGKDKPPADPLGAMPPEVLPSAAPAPTDDSEDPEAPAPSGSGKSSSPSKDPLKDLVSGAAHSDDKAARDAMLEKQRKLKMVGAVSGAVGGVGDAIGNAAVPFGGKGSSGTQQKINDNTNDMVDKNKTQFEEQLKNDPASEISRHYQKVLGLMLGKHAAGMDVAKMSASQIAATLPQVEKYMQKELGLSQIKSQRDLTMGMKQDQFDEKQLASLTDALDPSKQRAGTFADAQKRVNGIKRLEALMNGYENNLTPQEWEEAATAWNSIIGSAGGQSSRSGVEALVPHTARGNVQKTMQWFTNNPTGTEQQAFAQRMRQGMDREKEVNHNIVVENQLQRLGRAQGVADRHPDEARQNIESFGLGYDDVKKFYPHLATKLWPNGATSKSAPTSSPKSNDPLGLF